MNNRLLELSDYLKELKEQKSDLDAQLKSINAEIESVQKDMIELMTTDELTSFNRDGVTFSLVLQEYPSPEPDTKNDLWSVMKENGYEHLFTINSQTLQATLKEIIANNEDTIPEWLEGLIKVAEKATIRVTKSKK